MEIASAIKVMKMAISGIMSIVLNNKHITNPMKEVAIMDFAG